MTDTTTEPEAVLEDAVEDAVEDTPTPADLEADDAEQTDPDTFPRDYVEKLRNEAAEARVKAKKAEQYAHELHAARVAATGRLADPSDLPFDERHLDDLPTLEAAIDELLTRKPHLASRTPRGDVGQGMSVGAETLNLAGVLRSRA